MKVWIYMWKKNYRSKVDSKLFFLNNWKDGVAIYQDIDNYGRSSSFGRMAMISILYILSLRSILNLGYVETKIWCMGTHSREDVIYLNKCDQYMPINIFLYLLTYYLCSSFLLSFPHFLLNRFLPACGTHFNGFLSVCFQVQFFWQKLFYLLLAWKHLSHL